MPFSVQFEKLKPLFAVADTEREDLRLVSGAARERIVGRRGAVMVKFCCCIENDETAVVNVADPQLTFATTFQKYV